MSKVPFPQSVVSVASVVPESLGEGGLLQGHAPGAVLQYIAKLHPYQAVSQEKFGNKFFWDYWIHVRYLLVILELWYTHEQIIKLQYNII